MQSDVADLAHCTAEGGGLFLHRVAEIHLRELLERGKQLIGRDLAVLGHLAGHGQGFADGLRKDPPGRDATLGELLHFLSRYPALRRDLCEGVSEPFHTLG